MSTPVKSQTIFLMLSMAQSLMAIQVAQQASPVVTVVPFASEDTPVEASPVMAEDVKELPPASEETTAELTSPTISAAARAEAEVPKHGVVLEKEGSHVASSAGSELRGIADVTGSCSASGNCISSPNYPSLYDMHSKCTFKTSGTVTVESFESEGNFDWLYLGGMKFSGHESPESLASHFDPSGSSVEWTSDESVTKKGWKLCAESGTPSPTPVPTESPTTPAPTPSPTPVPTPEPTPPTPSPTPVPTPMPTPSPTPPTPIPTPDCPGAEPNNYYDETFRCGPGAGGVKCNGKINTDRGGCSLFCAIDGYCYPTEPANNISDTVLRATTYDFS